MVSCMLALSVSAGIENSQIWGYYTGDASGLTGLGNGQTSTFRAAIFVPGDGILKGASLTGVNVPFLSGAVPSKFYVFVGTTAGGKTLLNDTVTTASVGYNAVVFDSPIDIPATGLYVTYQFTGSGYPIAVADAPEVPGSIYLSLSATGAMDNYAGQGYGILGLQVYVDGIVLPDNAAEISSVNTNPCVAGSIAPVTVNLASNCNNGVKSIGYTLTVDGQATQNTVNLAAPIAGGLMKNGSVTIDVAVPAQAGAYSASISIDQVNGVANATPTTASFNLSVLSRQVKRMTVIEEFTGTGCGFCPRGWVGMEAVKTLKSDKAVVLALHQYNSSDAMYISQSNYANVGFDGAPQCAVDRMIYPDPYYGSNGENGILDDVDMMSQVLPTVAVDVKGAFTDTSYTKIDVSATTEFLMPTDGYTLAFVLTADSIHGTTSAFKQSNYFYQYSKGNDILEAMPELAKFYKGGEWAKSTVALTFNDVVIASSYVSSKTKVEKFGSVSTGDVLDRTYTLTMPTKAALVNALRYDQLFVTALVIDKKGQIANAARAHIPYGDPQAVENTSVEQPAQKLLINGQLQIRRGDNIYDALGRIVK